MINFCNFFNYFIFLIFLYIKYLDTNFIFYSKLLNNLSVGTFSTIFVETIKMPSIRKSKKNLSKNKKTQKRNSKRSSRSRKARSVARKMRGGDYNNNEYEELKNYINTIVDGRRMADDTIMDRNEYKSMLNRSPNKEEIINIDEKPKYRFYLKSTDSYSKIYGQIIDNNNTFNSSYEYPMYPDS